ncbi:Cortactin-binding protein 2 [Amphibalanus amphitrite]|uniref:Cortactin-binding protein 2 n=1 Tax=Amphibalanus amphitrite TaxID=1232801 RepID=A0A6A4XCL9_AMPAM|nr:Cortactin-binding protein 2 [Amphibalanus amphitrite]
MSPLMAAIVRTDEDEVKRLLESSPDLTERAQDGNSLFHLSASVGSAGCLRLLLQKWQMVYMTTDMIPVLTEVNASGSTVLHLAALRVSDQHLRTLVDYCPQLKLALRNQLATNLRQLASPECLRYLDSLGDSLERVCSVYIVCRLTASRHIIGQLKVGAAANWQWLTQSLFNLFIRHMQSLHRAFTDERPLTLTRKERSRSDPFPERGQTAALGLSPDAVESFSAGAHRWRRPDPAGVGRGPHQTLCEQQVDELLVTLRPAEDAAYGTALPLSIIHNYVRLLEGHHALILDVPDGWDRELLGRAVLAALAAQLPELPLVRLPADEQWPAFPAGAGPLLAHLDPVSGGAEAARRAAQLPAGSYLLAAGAGLESDGAPLPLLQLRPEAAPLSALPGRRLMRRLLEAAGGAPPPPEDAVFRTCRWAAGLGGRLLAAAARRRLPLAAPGAEAWSAARVAPGEPWRLIRWVQRLWETSVVPAVAAAVSDPATLEETLVYLRDAAVAEDCPLSGTDRDYLLSSFETRPSGAAATPEPLGSPGKRPRTPRHALRGLGPLLKKLPASPRHGRDS